MSNVRRYETERTRHFRSTSLGSEDANVIAKIEEFGCFVLTVESKAGRALNYTYTIGIFDTCGQPDLIAAGLHHEVAHACLNEAVRRLRAGADLAQGRHADLIGNVDCEFRPVNPKWVGRLMNWANWYYGRTDYPVLQVVYPDLQNRFPEDEGFNCHFDQPLMQGDGPMRHIEEDFWAAGDPQSSLFDWKFSDPPHTTVYLSKKVHEGAEPVTFVLRDKDGDWQFLGETYIESGGVAVCFHHPIDSDPTLKEIADIPLGWCAERTEPGSSWERHECEIEDELDEELG